MIEPKTPANEQARIEAVQLLKLLDTPAEERFDRITRIAKHMFSVPIVLITLVDTNRQWFKSRQGLNEAQTPRSVSFCGHAINQQEPLIIPNALLDERFSDNPLVLGPPNIRFYAGCPISSPSGYTVGTLCLIDQEPKQFTDADIHMLKELALLIEHEFRLTTLVTLDELTGISNRRGFEMLAQHALAHCKREQQNACMVFIDLDNFKNINDTHGHNVGDKVLQDFARHLSNSLRASDIFARMGGDEFVVLFSNTNEAELESLLTRLSQRIDAYNSAQESTLVLEYSLGHAEFTGEQSLAELITWADSHMYEHKKNKRDARR
ncbi:sensor domain-containing diguanylate cyclase [Pseudoalteromonas pernae]|uniref:sensor domain-containing diguanylate cyclase n=1 Tax=Pseudoalteromonas pernae TaxID=3118054 RepID=UPI003242FE44